MGMQNETRRGWLKRLFGLIIVPFLPKMAQAKPKKVVPSVPKWEEPRFTIPLCRRIFPSSMSFNEIDEPIWGKMGEWVKYKQY
jgi:hypothetical protein